jgi:D-alanyl-D-alanine dipeptidase
MCVLFDANVEICGVNRIFLFLCFSIIIGGHLFSQRKALSSPVNASFNLLPRFTETELDMIRAGMVNVKRYIPDAILDIRYATHSNFVGINVYGSYNKCYLQKDVALRLQKADSILKATLPGYKFVLYDCARPVWAQQKLWDSLKVPLAEKGKYVSNPKNKSVHNFGAAVDLSLADPKSCSVDMGTPFDYFGEEAYPYMESHFLKTGVLNKEQVGNRQLLRKVMSAAGFRVVPHEWWHFNACSREKARAIYTYVE